MISFAHPAPARRDVSADRHDTWGGDAMDALRPPDERGAMRTAKSRGPGAPTLASSLLVTNRQATEANKPGTPGRSRISRKPLRRECRLFWLPCRCLRALSAFSLHARLAGAACTRHSLRPPHRGRPLNRAGLGCIRAAGSRRAVLTSGIAPVVFQSRYLPVAAFRSAVLAATLASGRVLSVGHEDRIMCWSLERCRPFGLSL